MTDSRRLPAPGLMFIHFLIVFRPHANVQMEALLLPPPPHQHPHNSHISVFLHTLLFDIEFALFSS